MIRSFSPPALLLAVLLVSPVAIRSEIPIPRDFGPASDSRPFRLYWPDIGLVGLAVGVQGIALERYTQMEPATSDMLALGDLSRADRWAAGNYSRGAALASDVILLPGVALPLALSAWDAWKSGSGIDQVFTETLIYVEAMALSSSLNLIVRSFRFHPRPLVYGSDAPESEKRKGEASGSFYSGHANGAFVAATYLAYTYPLRHPEFRHKELLWAGALGTAATVAGLRVAAGKHFPSDVVVGAAAGAFFGWALPRMHLAGGSDRRVEMRLIPIEEGVRTDIVARF